MHLDITALCSTQSSIQDWGLWTFSHCLEHFHFIFSWLWENVLLWKNIKFTKLCWLVILRLKFPCKCYTTHCNSVFNLYSCSCEYITMYYPLLKKLYLIIRHFRFPYNAWIYSNWHIMSYCAFLNTFLYIYVCFVLSHTVVKTVADTGSLPSMVFKTANNLMIQICSDFICSDYSFLLFTAKTLNG